MSEKRIIVDDMKVQYEGLFDAKDLYRVIENWIKDNGYDKKEQMNTEHVSHSGKFVEIKFAPYKTITDYAKLVVKLKVTMNDVKDVEVKKDSHKMHLQQGKVTFSFQGIVETDHEGKWETKPILFFIRTVFDKYVYRVYTGNYDSQVGRDVNMLAAEIKRYLNLQKMN